MKQMAKGKRATRRSTRKTTRRTGRQRVPSTGGLAALLPAAISIVPGVINAIGGLFKKKK